MTHLSWPAVCAGLALLEGLLGLLLAPIYRDERQER
jgi:hypothetical protein